MGEGNLAEEPEEIKLGAYPEELLKLHGTSREHWAAHVKTNHS